MIAVQKIAGWERLKTRVLDGVSSPITERVYNMALDELLGWVPAGAAAGLHEGDRERLADTRRPRPGFVFDHHPHVGDS